MKLKRERGQGRGRIAHVLGIPEGTVRHILQRNLPEDGRRRRKKRKVFYPAHWAWDEDEPFRLA